MALSGGYFQAGLGRFPGQLPWVSLGICSILNMSFADMQMVCRRRVEFIRINCETMPNRVSYKAPLAKCQILAPHFLCRCFWHSAVQVPGTATLHLRLATTNKLREMLPCPFGVVCRETKTPRRPAGYH